MSALALRLLLAFAPASSPSPAEPNKPPPPRLDDPSTVIEIVPPEAPGSEGPAPEAPSPEGPPPDEQPEPRPAGTTPPGEMGGVIVPEPMLEPEAEAWNIEERNLADLPYSPTAARRSAIRRNNDILVRPFKKPLYSISAAARMGVQLASNREIVQPFGWGLAAHLRLHFVRVVKARFGIEVHAGHNRWQQRQSFEPIVVGGGGESTVTRVTLLTHNDFGAGPSFEIPIGAVFLQVAGTGGVAVSTLARPISADAREDLLINDVDPLVRGGLAVGVPILNRHGMTIGGEVQHVFSNREVAANPVADPDGAQVVPFGTWMAIYGAYTIWF